jgi:ubiquitin C-terminal hydrolase
MKRDTETITVTVTKTFAKKLREVSHLFDESLGATLQEQCEWHLDELLEEDDSNFWRLEEEAESRYWKEKSRANRIAHRLAQKMKRGLLVSHSVYDNAWEITVDSR